MISNKAYTIYDIKQQGYIVEINNKRYIGHEAFQGIQFETYDQALTYIQKIDRKGYDNNRYDIMCCGMILQ
jgi:hypothetical protein